MFIRKLEHAHLTPIFQLHNIHLVFSTCPHIYKCILCFENPVLNVSLQVFGWSKNYLIIWCFKNTITTYLRAKNSLHTTRSFKYVFVVFSEKNQMLKHTIKKSRLVKNENINISELKKRSFGLVGGILYIHSSLVC